MSSSSSSPVCYFILFQPETTVSTLPLSRNGCLRLPQTSDCCCFCEHSQSCLAPGLSSLTWSWVLHEMRNEFTHKSGVPPSVLPNTQLTLCSCVLKIYSLVRTSEAIPTCFSSQTINRIFSSFLFALVVLFCERYSGGFAQFFVGVGDSIKANILQM